MGFFGGVDDLERFLTRSCYLSVASVPACWGLMISLIADGGWHFSLLLGGVLPLIAGYLGIRAKREIRTGMSATAFGLAFVSLPLIVASAYLGARNAIGLPLAPAPPTGRSLTAICACPDRHLT